MVAVANKPADPNCEHNRKKAEILNLVERMIDELEPGRMFGEFGITFTAQSGKIGYYEESRRRTFK